MSKFDSRKFPGYRFYQSCGNLAAARTYALGVEADEKDLAARAAAKYLPRNDNLNELAYD